MGRLLLLRAIYSKVASPAMFTSNGAEAMSRLCMPFADLR